MFTGETSQTEGNEKEKKSKLQCWSCRGHGHRAGDRKCPKFISDATQTDRFRWSHEDPMRKYIEDRKRKQKEERIQQLKDLIEQTSSSDDSHEGKKKKKKHHKLHRKKKVKRLKSSHTRKDCDYKKRKIRHNNTSDTDEKKRSHKHSSDTDERRKRHKQSSESDERRRPAKHKHKLYKERKKDHNGKVKKHHKVKHKKEK
ncbi:retinitis pigmentosa 9 protein homolog [Argopecten irradians]|uniref:retinitis pigmentosa 9 protein homolog n=1 Tax=Argopecten irradians TaxID=31199 RepID=UPI0037182342